MTNSEQPVNCPLCRSDVLVRFGKIIVCPNEICRLSLGYDLDGNPFPNSGLKEWNKAFGPKEIDLDKEQSRFMKWHLYKNPTNNPLEYWEAWKAALENRDE